MNKNILLINPPQGGEVERPHFFPVGLAYVSSALTKHNYSVDVLDLDAQDTLDNLRTTEYDLIGISGYINHAKIIKSIISDTRDRGYQGHMVLGGMLPTSSPEFSLSYTGADIGVLGEGEETILEILESQKIDDLSNIVFRDGDEVIINNREKPKGRLEDLAFPDWDKFNLKEYTGRSSPYLGDNFRWMGMVTSRGCPYKCVFCGRDNQKPLRSRSNEDVIQEIKELKKRYSIEEIGFECNTITNKNKILDLTERIQSENLKISYSIDSRVDRMDEEILKALKESGCKKVFYGFESASQQVIDFFKKGFDVDKLQDLIGLHHKYDIGLNSEFIIGVPFESEETIMETVKFCKKNKISIGIDNEDVLFSADMYYMTPLPGTMIWNMAKEKVPENELLESLQIDINHDLYKNIIYNFTQMSDEELEKLRNRAVLEINSQFQ